MGIYKAIDFCLNICYT